MWRRKPYLGSANRAKKKRLIRIAKVSGIFIGLVCLIFGISYISSLEVMSVGEILVSGNIAVDATVIYGEVEDLLNGKYLRLFSRRNILIYPKSAIRDKILGSSSEIKDVEVSLRNFNNLSVKIVEYKPAALWCGAKLEPRTPSSPCYFMDDSGYFFSKAPFFSDNVYLVYYGEVKGDRTADESIIGKQFIPPKTFSELSIFMDTLKSYELSPVRISRDDNGDYAAFLLSGAKILFSERNGLATTSDNFLTLVNSGKIPFKDKAFLSNLDYLDLRYGNKIFYKNR